jgi:hypothetical protein
VARALRCKEWLAGNKIVVIMEAIELQEEDVRLAVNTTAQGSVASITVVQCAHARLLQALGITADQIIGIDEDELEPATYSISVPLPGLVRKATSDCKHVAPNKYGPYFVWELDKMP